MWEDGRHRGLMNREMGREGWGSELWGKVDGGGGRGCFCGRNGKEAYKEQTVANWRNTEVPEGMAPSSVLSLTSSYPPDAFLRPHLPALLPFVFHAPPVTYLAPPCLSPSPGDELPLREHRQGHNRGFPTVSRDRVVFGKHCEQHAQQQQDQACAQVG